MEQIKWIILLFFLLISGTWSDTLEIKINQGTVDLPYWPAQKAGYGAVLLVKGGEQEQGSPILAHLARQLANNGWSVALLNTTKSTIPWVDQLPEAISVLRQDNNKRIVLVHYGDEVNLSLDYFAKPQSKMINGLVLLSAYNGQNEEDKPFNLRFPLFDIAGQFDYDTVLDQMGQREREFKKQKYMALELPGAHHDYEYSQRILVAYVHGWMMRLPEIEIHPPPIPLSYIAPVNLWGSYIASIKEADWSGFMEHQDMQ